MRAALLLVLVFAHCGTALGQSGGLPSFPRTDDYLVLEYDRYSLKMLHRDPTPLLRIYGSGRVLLYYSAWSPRAGVYEMRLSTAELDQLVAAIAGNALDVTSSIALAEAAEEAEQESRNLRGELYYSSDSTISELNVYWTNARTEPLLFENLQDTARRHDWQPDINGYADVERALLAIAARKSGVLIAQPTPANELR